MIYSLGRENPLGVVGVGHTGFIHGQGDQLVEAVVGVGCATGILFAVGWGGLAQDVAVGVIREGAVLEPFGE